VKLILALPLLLLPLLTSADRILFVSDGETPGANILYSMRDDGADIQRITTSAHSEFAPAISPDGNQIAYIHRDGVRRLR
jgi:Tol biopolymer transport system component